MAQAVTEVAVHVDLRKALERIPAIARLVTETAETRSRLAELERAQRWHRQEMRLLKWLLLRREEQLAEARNTIAGHEATIIKLRPKLIGHSA